MKKVKVGFTYDIKEDYESLPEDLADKYAEFDVEETIADIGNSLKSSGHEVERIGRVNALIQKLIRGERWDIVFNIAEGVKGRNRESQVPLILELFGIPYVGSDALTMGLTLDKAIAKMIVSHCGVLIPEFLKIEELSQLDEKKFNLKYPVIIKPSEEGTSKGLAPESVARDFAHVRERAQWVINTYSQPALVEEFIKGTEFTVAVIENSPSKVLPPVQITINGETFLGEEFYTHSRVANDEIKYVCPAEISKSLEEKLKAITLDSYKALGLKDFGRVDFRVDENETPYFLECNPLPNLGRADVFPLVAKAEGLTYEEIICKILAAAIKRYHLT